MNGMQPPEPLAVMRRVIGLEHSWQLVAAASRPHCSTL